MKGDVPVVLDSLLVAAVPPNCHHWQLHPQELHQTQRVLTQVPERVQVASGGQHATHHPTDPAPGMHEQLDLVHEPEQITLCQTSLGILECLHMMHQHGEAVHMSAV